MKRALIASWVFFALVFAARSVAYEYTIADAFGQMRTIKVYEESGNPITKYSVHLDDDEIARIKEACK